MYINIKSECFATINIEENNSLIGYWDYDETEVLSPLYSLRFAL